MRFTKKDRNMYNVCVFERMRTYYSFLLEYPGYEEVDQAAAEAILISKRDGIDQYKAADRVLYRLARDYGWKRLDQKNGMKWKLYP